MTECPCLSHEFIGSDSALICRKTVAQKLRFECMRTNQWKIAGACSNLERMLQISKEEVRILVAPRPYPEKEGVKNV